MKVKSISLSEVAQQEAYAPIWVLNNAHRSHVNSKGNLILGIPRLNGASVDVMRVESTWLPIDVTAQVPRSQLLQSTEFRRALMEELIILVSDETAQKLLRSEGADEEQRRLEVQREYIKAATGVQPLADDVTTSGADEDDEDDSKAMFDDWLRIIPSRDDTQVLAELRTRSITRKQAKRIIQVLDPIKHIRSKNLLARSLDK